MERVAGGTMTVPEAAQRLGLSHRQVQRLKKSWLRVGASALVHGNRGRRPARAVPDCVRAAILEKVATDYRDASCAHLAELLAEHDGIEVSAKSIARILKQAGIANPHTHRPPRRRRTRRRKEQEGDLVQMDASPHDWLEGRGPRMSLHGVIDDATGKVLGLRFRKEEDTNGYLDVLEEMILRHGVPRALYTDRHGIFVMNKPAAMTLEEELDGQDPKHTQFGRALHELGIEHVRARSPQAKGRIERLWGTLQKRLIIELRLAGADTLEAANQFLPAFQERHNARFSVAAASPDTAFIAAPPRDQLDQIICFRHTRRASNGSTVSFRGKTWQLADHNNKILPLKPFATVYVLERDGHPLRAGFEGQIHPLTHIETPQKREDPKTSPPSNPRKGHKPPDNHPWRRYKVRTTNSGG